jgi:hypothetical protein
MSHVSLIELGPYLGVLAGIVGGWTGVDHHHAMDYVVSVVGGALLGFAVYFLCLLPGIAMMSLSPDQGLTESRRASFGALLIFMGYVCAPVAAFFVASTGLEWLLGWIHR